MNSSLIRYWAGFMPATRRLPAHWFSLFHYALLGIEGQPIQLLKDVVLLAQFQVKPRTTRNVAFQRITDRGLSMEEIVRKTVSDTPIPGSRAAGPTK
jgi:hypothetical protein